jgi:hypothetical protein
LGGVRGVIGVVERAWIKGSEGRALVRFSERDEVKPIKADVQSGILRHVSVGYTIEQVIQIDRVKDVPVLRVTQWTPYEISQTPIAVDDAAVVRGHSESESYEVEILSSSEEKPMSDEIKTAPEPKPAATETRASAVVEATRAAAEKREQAAEASTAAVDRATKKALAQEREREVEIRGIVRRAGLGDDLADKLIKEGSSINDVRAAAFDHLTTRSDASAQGNHLFEAGDDQRDKFVRGGVASILQRAGLAPMIVEAKKNPNVSDQLKDVSTDAGEFRGMHLIDLARAALERAGQSTRGLHGEALVKRALQFRGDPGMNNTSDFSILLETAVNKVFLGSYAVTPTTWRRWCGVKSVQDFRTSTFYRPGSFGKLDKVPESGEVKHKNIVDGEKSTLTPSTVGNIIGLTRRAIVNDDLGAFRDLAAMLGQAAAYTVEADAFALLTVNSGLGPTQTDGQPLFHTNRANIGATGAMSVTTWDSAAGVMAAQKDVSKNMVLDLQPAIWLGPRTLQATALQLNRNTSDPTVNKSAGVANPVQGMVKDVVATGQLTGTRHYFLADPSIYPVFAVGFIDGQEAPRIDSEQQFEYDGVQWRIILDYGVAVLDYRGAVTSAGA